MLSDNVGHDSREQGLSRFKDGAIPVGGVSCCSSLPILLIFALRQGNVCSPG